MALEGTGYVPVLGAGYALLRAIGNALPDSFWRPRADMAVKIGDLYRRLWCLAGAGYSLEQIRDIFEAEGVKGLYIGHDTPASRVWWEAMRQISTGRMTQDQIVQGCAEMVEKYQKPYISPAEAEGGAQITFEGEDRDRKVVLTPWSEIGGRPGLPEGTIPATPTATAPQPPPSPGTGQTPSGRGRVDPLSLIQAVLQIWQNLQRWGQMRTAPRFDVSFQVPGGWGGALPSASPQGVPDMAYVNTSVIGGEGGMGGLLSQALRTAATIWGPNQAAPGGARYQAAGLMPSVGLPFIDIVPQGSGACMTNLTSPFSAGGMRGARAQTHIQCDPITGRPTWFKPAGRPLLWSGDLSACKRVRKVAARARRAKGR